MSYRGRIRIDRQLVCKCLIYCRDGLSHYIDPIARDRIDFLMMIMPVSELEMDRSIRSIKAL
ncbi:MAG: hypothetical protein GY784_17105 [Gammaproteobacteria bacterium]|nr:hypothetical protein [Gammaproteobacteria bacterium]